MIVQEFSFNSPEELIEFGEDVNGVFKIFVDGVESKVNYIYREFYKESNRYALYEGPILFDNLAQNPLQMLGREILEKSIECCKKAYDSNDNDNDFLSIGTDAKKKVKVLGTDAKPKDYSTKVFWCNDTSNKTLILGFRGTVDKKKAEFVEDWMTNFDIALVKDKMGMYYLL